MIGSKRFGRSILEVSSGQAVAGVLKVALPMVVARYLDPDEFGVYSLVMVSLLLIFNLGNVGISATTTFQAAGSRWSEATTAYNAVWLATALGVVATVVGGICVLVFRSIFVGNADLATVLWGLAAIPGYFVVNGVLGLFLGRHEHRRYSWLSIGFHLVALVATAVALSIAPTATAAVAGWAVASLVVALAAVLVARPAWQGGASLDPAFLRSAVRFGAVTHASMIVTFLSYRIDVLLVGALLGADAAGLYAAAAAVGEVVWFFSQVAGWVLFARVAGDPDTARRRRITDATARLVLLSSVVVSLVIAAVASPLLGRLYGPEYEAAAGALQVLLVGIVLLSVSRVLAQFISAVGRPSRNIPGSVVALVVNVVLNLALIPWLGIVGASVASAVSYGLTLAHRLHVYRTIDGVAEPWITFLVPRRSDISLVSDSIRRTSATGPT